MKIEIELFDFHDAASWIWTVDVEYTVTEEKWDGTDECEGRLVKSVQVESVSLTNLRIASDDRDIDYDDKWLDKTGMLLHFEKYLMPQCRVACESGKYSDRCIEKESE